MSEPTLGCFSQFTAYAAAESGPTNGKSLGFDVAKLFKQQCPVCSGYGHAAKDCPTAVHLS